MLSLSRLRTLMLGCALLIPLISVGSSRGQAEGNTDVDFKTNDGVKIAGKLYAGGGGKGKRDAVVLLIPNFDLKKGGGIQQQGYDELAKALQKEGYTVLSFDFRGFGDSKTVDPLTFWTHPHNGPMNVRKKLIGGKPPEKIDHKDFQARYAEYFVNDIAAAKAFLDQENDNKTLNSSNVIVIGAGYGATLGAMWVANECKRRRDLSVVPGARPMLGDLESEDIAGTVWLSLSPTLPGGRSVPLTKWIVEAGKANKIPMAFIHGKNDGSGVQVALNMKKAIMAGAAKKDFEFTGIKEIPDTKLTGSGLLGRALGTDTWILEKYLAPVMDKRTKKRRTDRKVDTSRFYYTQRSPEGTTFRIIRLNKDTGVKVPGVDVRLMMSP
jgi:pimeloyl-ACP methyl ester carboxylesterase